MKDCQDTSDREIGGRHEAGHDSDKALDDSTGSTSGDEILQQWISRHGAAVRRYLLHFVGAPDVAEDLFQDVFLRASIALDHYHEKGRARAFLLRIAERAALAHFRDRRRQSTASDKQWLAFEPIDAKSPAQSIEQRELNSKLRAAMGGLPVAQREVISFRFFHHLDFRTIASILNCPRSTVFSHCRRGLARLRTKLKDAE